ncbi:extracellular solute-binding protein [Paenibacillus arenilitoris]|uniref:Extracellular solute-binding protein n=1 Tax=Paenibacillus arenilitoris TaxID=2772299 RepID=A0A927H433_9BACL|nr:extracellular solute-binding protein [Paenibacillus arenilitoris]MBD2867048.1 extracellular solute-binding protein [Paenibacillus arenilitoris]
MIYKEPGLGKYDPPIDVSFVRENGTGLENLIRELPGQSMEDNAWSRLYEEVLGIRIRYDWLAKGDLYRQKLGVSIASGDIPDVVKVNAQQLRLLANAGLIRDMTETYEKYATPLTKRILSQEGTRPFDSATIDGKLMAIPETSASIEGAQFIWIRMDWLERLGMRPPRTMDDLLAISKAFTEKDPDQNGENDTYGLAVTQYLWDPVMGIMDFMAGYGAYPKLWLKDDSGKLVYGGIQPEVKTALRALQEMYESGQIDPEFGLKDGNKVKEVLASGKLGMFYGEQWGSFVAQASRELFPDSEWQAFPIVSADGELPKVPLRFSTHQFLAVRNDYPYPEAVVKMFNLHLEKNWGETAEYETYYSNPFPVWQLSPITPYPARKNLEAFLQLKEARRTGDFSMLKDEAKAIQKNIDTYLAGSANKDSGWGWAKTYGPDGAFAILDRYERNGQLLYESFVGAPTDTMIDKQAVLDELELETFINIILGRSVGDFDRFVEEWTALGGNRITAEVNQWFAEKHEP